MAQEPRSPLEQLLEGQRREKSLREESLGPIAAAVGVVRKSCATTRLLLDNLESTVGFHLEILDALLRRRFGNHWWEDLTLDTEHGEEAR